MLNERQENFKTLSKDELIFLLNKMERSMSLICETCVEVSKSHIDAENAVKDIRKYIYFLPDAFDLENLKLDMQIRMGTITPEEARKIYGTLA